jgi:hypothetical protein
MESAGVFGRGRSELLCRGGESLTLPDLHEVRFDVEIICFRHRELLSNGSMGELPGMGAIDPVNEAGQMPFPASWLRETQFPRCPRRNAEERLKFKADTTCKRELVRRLPEGGGFAGRDSDEESGKGWGTHAGLREIAAKVSDRCAEGK